jgi:exodeoxyribonuclease V beta subunit
VKVLDPLALPLSGTSLIEASAGTGKTFTLSNLYLRLVVEASRQAGDILVVTYTNAATAELRDRIRGRLRAALVAFRSGPAKDDFLAAFLARRRAEGRLEADARLLEDALRSFDEAAIFTIHGFCQRMLHENAFESVCRFDAELVADQRPLCREIVEDHWVRMLHDAPPALVEHLRSPSAFADLERLVTVVVAHPDVRVLPDRPRALPRDELAAAIAARRSALGEAAALWQGSRDRILDLLTGSTLNRQQYNPEKVRSLWAPSLDDFFRRVDDDPPLHEKIAKLATGALQATGGRRPPEHPFFDACKTALEADARSREWLDEGALRFHSILVDWARTELRRRLDAVNAQSFDDLLHRLRDALRGPSGTFLADRIRERFPAALVDEFQDTDPVQYEILRTIYRDAPGPLLLIGDPKQAIYAFRGADVFAYLRARRDTGDAPHTLATNHRSDPALVEALNVLFSRAREPFLVERIPFVPMEPAVSGSRLAGPAARQPPLEILLVAREGIAGAAGAINKPKGEEVVAELVAAEITRLLESGSILDGRPLAPGDVAVLCRTNAQATLVQARLRALGVPSVRHGDDSVFDSDEAGELEHVLRAVAEPGDAARLRRALATTVIGLDASALHALQGDEDLWDRWASRFRSWLDTWMASGFMPAFRRLVDEAEVATRLLGLEGGERCFTNLLHLAELLQAESMSAHRGPLALVDWLALMRTDPDARELGPEAAEVRLESDALAVQLTTVHRSKGLEYAIVYCPFLWDRTSLRQAEQRWVRFHASDPEGSLCLDIAPASSPEHRERCARAARESLAEGLRLLYVALTRARHRCSVVWGGFSGAESSPLAYLLHQPAVPPGSTGDELATGVEERFRKLGDATIAAELRALADDADGRILVRAALRGEPPRYRSGATVPPALVCRTAERVLATSWRTSSFSALVSSTGRLGQRAEEGVDHDALELPGTTSDATVGAAPDRPSFGEPHVRLHDFPSGARAGQLVHDVFENLDFTADDRAIAALVERRAERHGFDGATLLTLAGAVRDVLETPLASGDRSFRLGGIAPGRTVREMPFTLPVAHAAAGAVDPGELADAFASLGGPLGEAYAPRLRRLDFAELRGYLTGFVDLVLEHDGRWWIVDYKSNHLGPHPEDYRPDALAQEMLRHHYVLQSYLYVLALHAHLARRLPGYDYDRHLGGALYLFVRGMCPAHPPGFGVFADRPQQALIERLAVLFSGRRRGAAAGASGAAER